MTTVDTFEVFDPKTTAENPLFKTESQKPDPIWTDRITPLAVGYSFRVQRTEGETVRQMKKRINRAAGVSFKTLFWKSEDQNVPEGQEPKRFIVQIKALDLKAKAEFEKKLAQNGVNQPSTEPPANVTSDSAPDGSAEGASAQGPRRPR